MPAKIAKKTSRGGSRSTHGGKAPKTPSAPRPGADVDFTPALKGAGPATKKLIDTHVKDAQQIRDNVQNSVKANTEQSSRQIDARLGDLHKSIMKKRQLLEHNREAAQKQLKETTNSIAHTVTETVNIVNTMEKTKHKTGKKSKISQALTKKQGAVAEQAGGRSGSAAHTS